MENIDIDIDIDKDNLKNIDIDIDIDMAILENIDIDIDIDKGILQNIDIDKISYRLGFGISNTPRPIPLSKSQFSRPRRVRQIHQGDKNIHLYISFSCKVHAATLIAVKPSRKGG